MVLGAAAFAAVVARYHHHTCGTVLQPVADRFFDDVCDDHTTVPAEQD